MIPAAIVSALQGAAIEKGAKAVTKTPARKKNTITVIGNKSRKPAAKRKPSTARQKVATMRKARRVGNAAREYQAKTAVAAMDRAEARLQALRAEIRQAEASIKAAGQAEQLSIRARRNPISIKRKPVTITQTARRVDQWPYVVEVVTRKGNHGKYKARTLEAAKKLAQMVADEYGHTARIVKL